MLTKIKSFFRNYSFPAKWNYPVYNILKNKTFLRTPVISRFFLFLCSHFYSFRKGLCETIVNERIVELATMIKWIEGERLDILDVGSDESILPLHLASIGHRVTALDLNNCEFSHPNLDFKKGDATTVSLDKKFDYITFLSTLEHIGLDYYGYGKTILSADHLAIENLKKYLKDNGRIIISVPYGKHSETKRQRVYNSEMIQSLFQDFVIEKEIYFMGIDQKYWKEVSKDQLLDIDSIDITQGVAIFCLLLKS